MPKTPPPPPAPPPGTPTHDLPTTPPDSLWFDGLLEGSLLDAAVVAEAERRLRADAGLNPAVEIDGGRFSILFSGERATPRPGSADDPRDVCLAVMQELVSAMPEGRELESTCRATAIHGETVVETLFAQVGGQVRGIGKVRPAVPGDAAWNVNSPTGGLWKRVGLAGLFLLAICFFAWQTGLVDRAFSASAADLAFSTNGDLSGLVRFETTQSAGNYVVTATPAAGWPATVAEADAVRAAAATPLDRAMIDAVLAGRTLDVELQNEAGESLARAPLSCAPLLQGPSEPGKPVETKIQLPGRIAAKSIRVALRSGF